MIEAIEDLLKHWGEQHRKNGSAGGLGSTLGTILEYGGCAPRGGVYGTRELVAGAGPDHVAEEIEAALVAVGAAADGAALMTLARVRYRPGAGLDELSLAEQIDVLELGRGAGGRSAYFRLLERLHVRLEAELTARAERLKARRREAGRAGGKVRAASLRQAKAAHRARGVELFKGEKA
ncbi:hypothetical protein [Metapseudomonas furukawaii]|uniref:Uncharacterized protein n=1 Tax=Metapseudomonas furukawaii TaxID=1149133 RepID=A0AAD1C291_METFU|nr:hypothetical protein [Pseudomonas furukawaii]ELS25667.1 hypothetical protein ppKF707_0763 [Pseudomonas furukawaii]BAU76144.1 hypothetical protein KF707C_44560 [Pseudomonas furukawaii]